MRRSPVASLLALALCAAACAGSPAVSDSSGQPPTASASSSPRTVTVLAAASLTKAFTAIAAAYNDSQPGFRVRVEFSGSADLLAQLDAGAPGDVLATADEATMAKAAAAELVGRARPFAGNRLTIITERGNPKAIQGPADLVLPGVLLVVCAPTVPCGAAAARLAKLAGLVWSPISEESKVTDVVAKVASGVADAGLVYRTDALAAAVTEVPLPESLTVRTVDMIATVSGSSVGAGFVEFVLGEQGRRVLADAGFSLP